MWVGLIRWQDSILISQCTRARLRRIRPSRGSGLSHIWSLDRVRRAGSPQSLYYNAMLRRMLIPIWLNPEPIEGRILRSRALQCTILNLSRMTSGWYKDRTGSVDDDTRIVMDHSRITMGLPRIILDRYGNVDMITGIVTRHRTNTVEFWYGRICVVMQASSWW